MTLFALLRFFFKREVGHPERSVFNHPVPKGNQVALFEDSPTPPEFPHPSGRDIAGISVFTHCNARFYAQEIHRLFKRHFSLIHSPGLYHAHALERKTLTPV